MSGRDDEFVGELVGEEDTCTDTTAVGRLILYLKYWTGFTPNEDGRDDPKHGR